MNHIKSHGETYLNVTEALLQDMSSANEIQWFPPSVARLTYQKVVRRVDAEGLGFLTKTLPRYGKALDRALSGSHRLSVQGFKTLPGSNIPKFLGEFTSRVFNNDGWIKPDPCIVSVNNLRLLMSLWYKLELTYETEQEASVLNSFTATEDALPDPYTEHASRSNRCDKGYSVTTESADCTVVAACPGISQERDSTYKVLSDLDEPHYDTVDEIDRGIDEFVQEPWFRARADRWSDCRRRIFDGTDHGRGVQELGNLAGASGASRSRSSSNAASGDNGHSRDENRARSVSSSCRDGSSCYEDVGKACGTGCETESSEQSIVTEGTHACDDSFSGAAAFGIRVDSLGNIDGLTFDLRHEDLIGRARANLARLLSSWDPYDIIPQHGPGAVSGRETQAEKRHVRRFIPALHEVYPYDQYMFWSPSHLCDEMDTLQRLETVVEPTARIVLVPKDSRGPRVISCENAENMRIQQGIMKSLVVHIETHPLTKGCVSFTDQTINGTLAAEGSSPHGCATLDLKDASDRLSMRLVQMVWPEHLLKVLTAVRSTHTVLPSGRRIRLKKHAPMGSSLCFPVMAATIWAVATACVLSKYSLRRLLSPREVVGRVFVYGDDVITPENDAIDVMAALEAVGLKINRDKSFAAGPFKESCGEDWFASHRVNGIKIRTPWSSRMSAGHYTSWIDYSNQFYARGCYNAARVIAIGLERMYGSIPRYPARDPKGLPFPALVHELGQGPDWMAPKRKWHKDSQSYVHYVWVSEPVKYKAPKVGWCDMLDLATRGTKPPAWQSARLESVETKYLNLILGTDKLTVTGPSDGNVSDSDKQNAWDPMRSFAMHKRSKLRRAWRGDSGRI